MPSSFPTVSKLFVIDNWYRYHITLFKQKMSAGKSAAHIFLKERCESDAHKIDERTHALEINEKERLKISDELNLH